LLKENSPYKKQILGLFQCQYCAGDVEEGPNALEYAFSMGQENVVMKLLEMGETKQGIGHWGTSSRVSLAALDSGRHTSRFSNYNRRAISASRGSKEGNNAFADDLIYGGTSYEIATTMPHLLPTVLAVNNPSLSMYQKLEKKYPACLSPQFDRDAVRIVRSGNLELARHFLSTNLDFGFGLNQTVGDVLSSSCSSPEKLCAT